jgi:hypothetical protein
MRLLLPVRLCNAAIRVPKIAAIFHAAPSDCVT